MSDVCREIVEELEWSSRRAGQGAYMGGPPLTWYAACPECGGLKEPNGEFISSAVGHRFGCKIALALGRQPVVKIGR